MFSLRLMLLPSFGPSTLIRFDQDKDGRYVYTFKALGTRGELAAQSSGRVLPAGAQALERLLDRIAPLTGKTASKVFDPNVSCMDGTQFVLEASKAEVYNAITRHECEMPDGDALRALIRLASKISGGELVEP